MMETADERKSRFLQAFDELSDALFRHAYYRIYDREAALDLVQETFVRTWVQIEERGADLVSVKAFLYRVLNNLIIDRSRRKKEESLESLQEGGFDPAKEREEPEFSFLDAERALKALEGLPERFRTVVVMRYLDELGPGEIAELTGERENVISVRLHRALKMLRERMT